MFAAEEGARLLEAVTDDAGPAMRARRCQRMDRAFEAVKDVRLTIVNHLKGLVVIIPAGFADCHDSLALTVAGLQTAQNGLRQSLKLRILN